MVMTATFPHARAAAPERIRHVERPGPAAAPHKVVVIGSGFGGLFGTKALRKRARGRHHGRQDDAPPLPAAALPGGDRHPLRGRDRAARPARSSAARTTRRSCSARSPASTSRPARSPATSSAARPSRAYDSLIVAAGASQSYFGNDHFSEYAPGMKSIDDALELRGRIFGAFEMAELGANRGDNVDHLLTFVVVGAGPTGVEMAGQIAELAHRTLKRDFRAINTRERARDPARRRPPGAAALRPEARREGQGRAGEARRRGDPRRDGDRRRRARHRDEVQGRPRRAHQHRHQDLGRRRPGQLAGQDPRRADGRPPRPRRPDRGQPRPHAPGPPRGLRGRRHDRARQPPGRRAGRDPGRQVRRQGDRRTGSRARLRRSRSSTSTRARWRSSAASARSPWSASSASPA